MTIHNLVEKNLFKDYGYPMQDGIFRGILMGAAWSKHSIIHTFWKLDNGFLIDCALFKDCRPNDIELLPDNVYAELTLIRADSNKVYLRDIREIKIKR
jgi:hypothetical protein